MKTLILFAHPAFQKSKANRHLVAGISKISGVTFHDLYEHYPEFDIDVKKEQQLLTENDCIIFHHPMFWYSTPALLKEWQDLVLEHGWAYGSKGTALKGKLFLNALSTGGPKVSYQRDGLHKHTIQDMLVPIRQTAILCGMITLPPFVMHGTHALEKEDFENYKVQYEQLLRLISDDKFKLEFVTDLEYLNDYPFEKGV